MDTFYTPEEVAKQLKIHLQTVLNYIRDGRLKALHLDKGYRIGESDIQQFIKASKPIVSVEDYFERLGYDKKYKAFRKVLIKPTENVNISNSKLESLIENASVHNRDGYRAFPFPSLSIASENQKRLPSGIILEKEITFAGPLFFFTFASNKGEVLAAESLWEDTEDSRLKNSIGLLTCVGIIYRGLLFVPRYYSQIAYKKNVDFSFIIDKPMGRNLAMDSERPRIWSGNYQATTEDPIIIEKEVEVGLSNEDAKKITAEIFKDFLWYFKCELNDEVISKIIEEVSTNIQ